jgi:protein pelota
MKVIFSDFKKCIVKFRMTNPEDGWYLSQIIESEDKFSGKTFRKVAIGSKEEKSKQVQKSFLIEIVVEKVEFDGSGLRVSGKVSDGPEEVPKGSYHTFDVGLDYEYRLEKHAWLSYHKAQLKDAEAATHSLLLICVFDRDDALIAVSRERGYEILTRLRGDPAKKEKRANSKANFYPTIIKAMEDYVERFKPSSVILASPAFYKEDLAELIKDEDLKKKLVLATCSSAQENAVDEVLKRPETKSALQNVRVAQETRLIEEILTGVAQNGLVTYGFKYVKTAVESGAVDELLVTDRFIRESREKKTFKEVNELFKLVDDARGSIHIVSAEHDAGRKLQGLGGVAALLRYNV